MRKTIHKWFWAWDFDKEEKWLNEMAAKGLALVAIGVCRYTFEESLPGEYNIRLELLDNVPAHPESERYINFVEETGALYLGSIMRWVYFRKRTDSGEFNLFSDNNSRIRHINRVLLLLGVVGLLEISVGSSNLLLHVINGSAVNLFASLVPLLFGLLIAYGFIRIHRIKARLKKEQQLFE